MKEQQPGRIIELSEAEFHTTMNSPMSNVTELGDAAINIWPYVQELVKLEIVPLPVLQRCLVEGVYRDASGKYDHVLLPTDESMVLIGVVVDRSDAMIIGYYRIDIGEEYYLAYQE